MSDTSTDTTPAFQLLFRADCLDILRGMADGTVHAVVCDPPYELGFMGKSWDSTGIAYRVDLWREVLRVLKPGGHLLAFGGSRTYHRMACAIEDAGFELRDCCMWVAGSGFPKSLDVSKAIDKAAGVEGRRGPMKRGGERLARLVDGKRDGLGLWGDESGRDPYTYLAGSEDAQRWKGWGTALKPAFEPIVVARKPLEGTVAANVLKHGTGAMNIDASRVPFVSEADEKESKTKNQHADFGTRPMTGNTVYGDFSMLTPQNYNPPGRWPANILLSHDVNCDEDGCVPGCPCALMDEQSGVTKSTGGRAVDQFRDRNPIYGGGRGLEELRDPGFGDTGGASRYFNNLPIEEDDYPPFFYAAKASRKEREAGLHDASMLCACEDTRRAWESEDRRASTLAATDTSLLADTTASTSQDDSECSTMSNGSVTTEPSHQATTFTISTATSSTTESRTSPLSPRLTTSGFTPGATSEMASGGSPVESAESESLSTQRTSTSLDKAGPSTDDADPATSESSSQTRRRGVRVCPRCRKWDRKPGAGDATNREEGSDGMNSPRAGAGRTAKNGVWSTHPTVKALSVMSWLVNLVTPPGGIVMDPFMGSGTTGIAAVKSGFNFIGCEQSEEYMAIAEARIRHHGGDPEVVYAPNTETDTDKETAS